MTSVFPYSVYNLNYKVFYFFVGYAFVLKLMTFVLILFVRKISSVSYWSIWWFYLRFQGISPSIINFAKASWTEHHTLQIKLNTKDRLTALFSFWCFFFYLNYKNLLLSITLKNNDTKKLLVNASSTKLIIIFFAKQDLT